MARTILTAATPKLARMPLRPPRALRRPSAAVNAGLALLIVGGVTWAYLSVRGEPSADAATTTGVRTVTVSQGTVTATATAAGSVQSAATAGAAFATSGTVTEIKVAVGSKVRKGQVLARIDPSAAQRALALAEANLDAANDALTRARDADADTTAAENEVTQARLAVDEARAGVQGTTLTAPMAGTVVAVNGSLGGPSGGSSVGGSTGGAQSGGAQSGGAQSGGTPAGGTQSQAAAQTGTSTGFIDLVDLSRLQVTAAFAEADATRLKPGQPATVVWNALQNAQATGRVVTVDPQATTTNNVVTYGVTVSIGQLPPGARPGQTVSVSVVTGTAQDAVYVNSAAVSGSGDRHTVVVQGTDGTQQIRPVQVGLRGNPMYQITSGLTAGERVVLPQSSTGGATGTNRTGGGFPGGGAGLGRGGLPGGGFTGGGGLGGTGRGGNGGR